MKIIEESLIAIGILCTLGCSKPIHTESAKISLQLKDGGESTIMEAALTDLALKNGFNQKIYSNHDTWPGDPYKPFNVEYQTPPSRYFNVIAMENRTFYPKKPGGCLIITIIIQDEDIELKLLLRQVNTVLSNNIRDHRATYVGTECGVQPSKAIE